MSYTSHTISYNAKTFAYTCHTNPYSIQDPDFLFSVLCDDQLHSLLNLYHDINTNSYRPFRLPPSDANSRMKEVMATLKVLEVSEDLADIEELREILTQEHFRAMLQVRRYIKLK